MRNAEMIKILLFILLLTQCSSKDLNSIKGCWSVVEINNMKFTEVDKKIAAQKIRESDSIFKTQIVKRQYTRYNFDSLPGKLGVWPYWEEAFEFFPVTINNKEIIVARERYGYSIQIKQIFNNRFIAAYKKRTDSLGVFIAEMVFKSTACQ